MNLETAGALAPYLVGALNLCLLAFAWWRWSRAAAARQADDARLRATIDALQRELAALCSGAAGSGGRLARIERQLHLVRERQDRLEERSAAHREYDRAVRLIRGGAGVERLMEECSLTRAEADLLARMHGGDGGDTAAAPQVPGMRLTGSPM